MSVQTSSVQEESGQDPVYCALKRVVDLSIVLLLLPLCVPLLLLIMLAIRLDSPGPALFRQKRVGQDEGTFELLKLRSMYMHRDDGEHRRAMAQFIRGAPVDVDSSLASGSSYKVVEGQRVTRVGRFLRKTSLDELPQLFNVLRGEMSLVGPRPPLVYEVLYYSVRDKLRLKGKPGLTGIWQIYGRSRVTFAEMVEMDLEYLRKQSLLLDFKLVILTVPVMICGRGGM